MKRTGVRYYKPEEINGLELLTCTDANYHFSPHFHDSYCIWLNTSSAEAYSLRGNSGILHTGDIGIIAPGEVHSNCAFESEARQLVTFYLDSDRLQKVAAEVLGRSDSSVELRTAFHTDKTVFIGLVSLWKVLQNSKSTLERQSAFYNILSLIISRHITPSCKKLEVGKEQKRVTKVIEQFHERLDEDVRLDELSSIVDCTPYHLIRFFKKNIGLTPHSYLLQLRLEKAKSLLQQGQSIVDAAVATGFTDQSHLTRHFKLKFSLTPGAYRSQVLKN